MSDSAMMLLEYFTNGVSHQPVDSVGMEIETSFVDLNNSQAAALQQTQGTMVRMTQPWQRWTISQMKGPLISALHDPLGNRVLYELGRQNIELALRPATGKNIVDKAVMTLFGLYQAAAECGLRPDYQPVLSTDEDLLVIPDERDATWLSLDGRQALAPLATITAVQFTVAVTPEQAIPALNRLGAAIGDFLEDYPQEWHWRRYIVESHAGYHPLRYGGPLYFSNLRDYCERLGQMGAIRDNKIVPLWKANVGIDLFLRSVWWYFRLRRYGNQLCIEVRPLPRRSDAKFQRQLDMVLNFVRG